MRVTNRAFATQRQPPAFDVDTPVQKHMIRSVWLTRFLFNVVEAGKFMNHLVELGEQRVWRECVAASGAILSLSIGRRFKKCLRAASIELKSPSMG